MRPKPLIPTRTVIASPPVGWVERLSDYSRAWSACANRRGIVGVASAAADVGRHRLAPQGPDAALVGGELSALWYRNTSTRAPCSSTARRWSVASSPSVSGSWGRRLPTWTTRPGVAATRLPDPGRRTAPAAGWCRATPARARPGRLARWRSTASAARPRRPRGRGRPGGSSGCCSHRDLALDRRAVRPTSAFSTTGSVVAGSTRPTAPSSRPASSSAAAKSPSGLGEPDEERLPRACPSSSPAANRYSNASPTRSSSASATRHRRRSPGGEHAEVAPEPARRAAVVGDADHRGDRRRRSWRIAAQRRREPVPATERDDAGPSGVSVSHDRGPGGARSAETQALEELGELLGDDDAAVPAAGAADADREVGLALAHVRGQQQREQPLELVEERLRPRAAQHVRRAPAGRCRAAVAARRPSAGSAGSGSRTRGRRRAGSPCLYPNDTMLVCSDRFGGVRSPKSSRSRSRSSWTLRSDVSTTTSASPFRSSSSARSCAMPSDTRSSGRERVRAAGGLVAADEHVVGRVEEQHLGPRAALAQLARARPRARPRTRRSGRRRRARTGAASSCRWPARTPWG